MTIFAGGAVAPASGMTGASRQLSVAFCAIAVVVHNTIATTDGKDIPFTLLYLRVSWWQFVIKQCATERSVSIELWYRFCAE